MAETTDYSIQEHFEKWFTDLKHSSSLTESDVEELRAHFRDLMEDLRKKGLTDKEAFLVARSRIGRDEDIMNEFYQENHTLLQVRRSALILSGILIYFFLFHLIGSLTKLLFIFLLKAGFSGSVALEWLQRSLDATHFIIICFFTGMYLFDEKVIRVVEKIRIKPVMTITILIATIILGILDTSLFAIAKSALTRDYPLISHFILHLRNFNYIFPLLMCVGFVVIHHKYYRSAKVPF